MPVIKKSDREFQARRSSIEGGYSQISWVLNSEESRIHAGFGLSDGNESEFKTIGYDEVIFVTSGFFGVEIDGSVFEAEAGDVLHLRAGSRVRYLSTKAEFFFAISNPSLA